MQKFNSINLESKFIKNILQNTYIPTIPIVTDGDFIVSDVEYCYKNHIIKCEKSGNIAGAGATIDGITFVTRNDSTPNEPKVSPAVGDSVLCSEGFICGLGVRGATYSVIKKLNSHTLIPGFTHRYQSPTTYYDSDTHRYLGVYLRWYRDTYGIDLLPLYNCYCGETYSLAQIKNNTLTDGYDSSKSVSIVPIQLNKQYTVFVNSSSKISMCGAFLHANGRIQTVKNSSTKYLDELLDNTVLQFDCGSYNNPILYEAFTADKLLLGYTNQFYLMIQTDAHQFCPIVVLEGSYKNLSKRLVTSMEIYSNDVNANINYSLFNPPVYSSLTMTPTSYHIPYSSRLIEFLTEHAITSNEDIQYNISRIQNRLGIKSNDVWSDEMRFKIHHEYFKYFDKKYLKSSQLNNNHLPKEQLNLTNGIVYSTAPEVKYDNSGDPSNRFYKIVRDENNTSAYRYEPLTTKPDNWDTSYWMYYEYSNIYGFTPIKSISNSTGGIVGIRNCNVKRESSNIYDITGYVDKDVENKLFNYRSV